jgi:hypothetical protein
MSKKEKFHINLVGGTTAPSRGMKGGKVLKGRKGGRKPSILSRPPRPGRRP